MNVGIDTDGVLTDLYGYNLLAGGEIYKCEPQNPKGYDLQAMYGMTKREEYLFGLKYFIRYCKEWPPRKGAVEFVQEMNSRGHKLYEITARKFVTKRNPLGWYSRRLLKKWYKKHDLEFEEIFLCSEERSPKDKLDGCRRFGIKFMIEDKPDVAEYLSANGIVVFLFDAPYNEGVEAENIIRVHSWQDVRNSLIAVSGSQYGR